MHNDDRVINRGGRLVVTVNRRKREKEHDKEECI